MKGTIRSEQFDDVYFSADDGLAETEYVFLAGNDLPERFAGRDKFVIAETGFGTGLNFLAVWELFDTHRTPGQVLHFISFEQFPVEPELMRAALEPWEDRFGARIEGLIDCYPAARGGAHSFSVTDHVRVTLIFEDVNVGIPDLEAEVDCWFLDGFTPSKNPEMWSDILFAHMERLTRVGGTFATFTAAGFVKRGLRDVGFLVEKRKGFGRKRDMLVGHFVGENTK